MKTIYKFLCVIAVVSFFSCDSYLDKQDDKNLDLPGVFKKRATTERYLWNVYGFIPAFQPEYSGGSIFNAASDDIIVGSTNYEALQQTSGSWSPSSANGTTWKTFYTGIREANIFMDALKVKNWCPYEVIPKDEQDKMVNEARFLRAYYYFLLMRQYGPVVIMYDEIMDLTAEFDKLARVRSSWDVCVDYVISELNAVIPLLEDEHPPQWYGKPTKAAAMAIQARLMLYSARDQFNGNPDYKNYPELFPGQRDESKWIAARNANKALLEKCENELGLGLIVKYQSNGDVDPYASLYAMVTEHWNSETIWARIVDWGGVQYRSIPTGVGGSTCYGAFSPTQQMVDSYAMANGRYPIEGYRSDGEPILAADPGGYEDSGFENFTHPIEGGTSRTYKMYIGREPRFYSDIFWSGARWVKGHPKNLVLEFFRGGNSGIGRGNDYSANGYMLRKFTDRNRDHSLNSYGSWGKITMPMFRLAEIYLNYIETLIETDPSHSDILYYWNKIRERAGVPNIEDVYPEIVGNKELLTKYYRKERRIELAFEQHRYFDAKTWKIAKENFGGPIYGMNYLTDNHDEDGGFWQRTIIERRIFSDKCNLYPILQTEMDKNKLLIQNPGWE